MAATKPGRPHIMVVDDAPDVRETLGKLLEAHGFRVSLAGDGREAIQELRSAVPDLIIVDLDMPHIDGWELIRRIREAPAWSHLPAILSSGQDGTGRADEAGFDASLTKPAAAAEILRAINTLLLGRRPA